MMKLQRDQLQQRIAKAKKLWLFLDYDGTLDDFAPTPDDIIVNPDVVNLLKELQTHPHIRVAIISGRRLAQIEALAPVKGIFLAGTYGMEMKTPAGKTIHRAEISIIRPPISNLKEKWQKLLASREGFFLEDKKWSIAIHARFAKEDEAQEVLALARELATTHISLEMFRIMGGHKFLEVSPIIANKGRTVRHLLKDYPFPPALPVYLGDDDKDEEAFRTIHEEGGIAIVVSPTAQTSQADFRIDSPKTARTWLATLPNLIQK